MLISSPNNGTWQDVQFSGRMNLLKNSESLIETILLIPTRWPSRDFKLHCPETIVQLLSFKTRLNKLYYGLASTTKLH